MVRPITVASLIFFACFLLFVNGCSRSGSHDSLRVRINEVLPDGASFSLEEGSSEYDWVEIYNPNPVPVDLSRYYLSDDSSEPAKWRIPYGTVVEANGYLLIRVGGDPAGGLHASFGVNEVLGEDVVLTLPDAVTPVDSVEVPPLRSDVAWARNPDDISVWMKTATPTPGEENLITGTFFQVVDVTDAYPYTPVVVTVNASGEIKPGGLVFHYKIDPGREEDPLSWPGEVMSPVPSRPASFQYCISGRRLSYGSSVGYYVSGETEDGLLVYDPPELKAEGVYHKFRVGPTKTLCITEVMPSNRTFDLVDPENYDSTPDWIEIYNYGQKGVSLRGLRVREKLHDEDSAAYYEAAAEAPSLLPGQRRLIFADADPEDGHLNFELHRSGGILQLVEIGGYELDHLNYSFLERDQAYGPCGDSRSAEPEPLPLPSPRFSNPCGKFHVWFSGEIPVWAEWEGMDQPGNLNPQPGETVTIGVKLGWDAPWSGEEGVPAVKLFLSETTEGIPDATFSRVAGSDIFKTELAAGALPAGGPVNYSVSVSYKDETLEALDYAFCIGDVRSELSGLQISEAGFYDPQKEASYEEMVAAGLAGTSKGERLRTFVEIYNAGPEEGAQSADPVSLKGLYLSLFARSGDVEAARYHTEEWKISGSAVSGEGAMLAPGEYCVIELDGGNEERPSLLERYKGGAVSLYDKRENGNCTIDRFRFPSFNEWETEGAYGRVAGAEEGIALPPSPGEKNPQEPEIVINELSVWAAGESWIEIYSKADTVVALDGFKLGSNQTGIPMVIDAGHVEGGEVNLPPGSYAVVWIGDMPFDEYRDKAYLYAPDDWSWGGSKTVDTVPFDFRGSEPPGPGQSFGRYPDGTGELAVMPSTLGEANAVLKDTFIRGDCDCDGVVDLSRNLTANSDFLALQDYVLGRGEAPACAEREKLCEDRYDINDDGFLSVADILYFRNHVAFSGQPELPDPFPEEGTDPTADSLECE